ncbi:hypothetical protein H2201_005324 [Coniosporium apollinis]|uniref:Uncharacterized protein n=1 Tax=Coniosporium apollinis TaxID=61459 RepID=A0ABQ9NQ47_9PEZI|nr:hypothetical protein H2201_005324 [Coniosporium apollinis]
MFEVAQQFITDIQNIALATIQNSYPDKHIEVINRPSGPTLQWKDITLALEEVWITTADEKKSSGFVRKQKDKAAGYARFSVREHWSGMPTSAGVHHNLKEYSQFVAGFEQRFSQLVDSAPGAAFYVPCKIIPGKKCPEDEKDSGPWGPSWPVGYVVEV